MSRQKQDPAPLSQQRRRFLQVSGRYGFTTAVLAATGGYLWSDADVALAADDEATREKAAKHTMIFATEYKDDAYQTYPIMQTQFKENLQTLSKGAMYVKLYPAGQLGIGSALAQKVQAGTVQGGSVSLVEFLAVCTDRRCDQHPLLVRRESTLCQSRDVQGVER